MIPNTWREYLFRYRLMRLSRRAQRQLQSKNPSIVDATALWQSIEGELNRLPLTKTRKRRWSKGLNYSFAVLVVLPLLMLVLPSRTKPSYIKSASDKLEHLPTSTLGYALLDHKGLITRGDAGARVDRKTELALYVETSSLAAGRNFNVAIVVEHPDGRRETLLEDYRVAEEFEILKGRSGVFIFQPENHGVYHFSGTRVMGDRVEAFPGFQVEVYP